jgi:hypothetical protein
MCGYLLWCHLRLDDVAVRQRVTLPSSDKRGLWQFSWGIAAGDVETYLFTRIIQWGEIEALMAVNIQVSVFWVVTACSFVEVEVARTFITLVSYHNTTWRHSPEDLGSYSEFHDLISESWHLCLCNHPLPRFHCCMNFVIPFIWRSFRSLHKKWRICCCTYPSIPSEVQKDWNRWEDV